MPRQERLLEELNAEASDPALWTRPEAQDLVRRAAGVRSAVDAFLALERRGRDLAELFELATADGDAAVLHDVDHDMAALERDVRTAETTRMLSGADDGRDAIVHIHAGAGGLDAKAWVLSLLRMYTRWADARGFAVELLDDSPSEENGRECYDEVTIRVAGENAYGLLRSEHGVHRFVRVSPYDSKGRKQTAFVGVDVTPDVQSDDEIDVRPEDCDLTFMRAGGSGGQNQNKVESAVRLVHRPTGMVVTCRIERSQHQNRALAMRMLKARLRAREDARRADAAAQANAAKSDIAWGSQIRSYVLMPYRLVKDLRTRVETGDVDAVLDGHIDPFIEAYLLRGDR